MKKALQFVFLLGLLNVLMGNLFAQNITVEIDPIDIGAVEINQTDDCLRQNNNNWYGNVCDVPNDGDDPENTVCDDCFTGGSEDMDIGALWETGGNWSVAHAVGDETCGYKAFLIPSAGGTSTTWTVAKTETIRVVISGAEDDAGFCSSDLSGSNDGECNPAPYAYNSTLPWAYKTYNANTAAWYTDNGAGLDIDASRCPYDWTANHNSTIENCMKENGTNDYSFRWRYRWHFGDAAGNLSGMDAPDVNGLDFTTCSGPYDRTTLTASSFTDCDYATQWQVSVNGGVYTDIGGATANTYDPPSQSCGVYAYRVRKAYRTSFAGATGYTYSNTRTDIIQTAPTAGVIGSAQTICNGGNPATITSTTNGSGCGTITYIWQSAVSPFSTFNNIVGATGATYDPPAGLTVTTQYRRITQSAMAGGNTCLSSPTVAIQVTVQTVPTAGVIAGAQTICNGGNPAAFTSTTAGTGSGTITYRWESSVSPFSTWNNIAGATGPTYDAPAGLTVTTQFRRITVSTLNGVACESVATSPIQVTVQSVPTAGAVASPQTVCNGGDPVAFTSTTAGTGDGTITYRWESAVSPFSTWNNIAGATSPFYDAPAGLTVTTQYRRITVSVLNGVSCESVATTPIQVTVQSIPTAGVISTDETICNGGNPIAFTSSTAGTGSGTITFRWESSVSPFSTWNNIGGANGLTYDAPPGLTVTTRYRRITVSTLNGVACESVATTPIEVTVLTTPTTGVIDVSQTICSGGDPSLFTNTLSGSGLGTITYRWESSVSPFSVWNNIAGETGATYDAPAGLTATTQYRRITVSTSGGVSCESAATPPLQVTVASDPLAPSATQSPAASVCEGQILTLIAPVGSGGTGTCVFEYQFSTNGGTTYSGWSTTVPSFAATGIDNRIQIRRNCNGSGCDISPVTTYFWSVFADPTIPVVTRSPNVATVCVGQTLTVTGPTSTGGAGLCIFEYRYSTNGGSSFTAWSTTVPNFAATGTENWIETRRVCTGPGCNTSPTNLQIWLVNSDPTTPTVTRSPIDANVCVGQLLTVTSPSSTGGTGSCNFEYRFSNNGGSTYSAWSASVPNFAAVFGTNIIQTRMNCNGNGCDISGANTQIWSVVADPGITASGSTAVCSGGTALLSSLGSGGTGTCTYQWLSSPDNSTYTPIGGATGATYTTPPITAQTYFRVQRICSGADCQTATSNTLTISLTTGGTSSVTDTICANATYTLPSGLVVLGPGLYSDTIPGALCDSIITFNLITPPSSTHYGLYAADFSSYNQINPLTGALINSYPTTPGSSGWVNGAFTMHEQAAKSYWISETKQLNSLNLTNGVQTSIPCAIGSMSYFWGLRYYDGWLYTITASGDNDKVLVRFNPTTGVYDGTFTPIEINGSAAYEILIHSSPVIDPINGILYINLYGNRMLAFDINSGTGNLITLSGFVSPTGYIGLLEINEQTGEMFALSGFSNIVEITRTGATTATVSLVKALTSGSGFSNPISTFDSDNNLYIFQAESGCATQNPMIAVDVTTGQEWCTNPPGIAFTQLEYLNCKPASTLREVQGMEVKFYPNPVRGELTFELDMEQEGDVNIQIYNISGGYQMERHFNGEAGNNRFSLDLSNLTNGIYIIHIQNGKHQFAGKVIKL